MCVWSLFQIVFLTTAMANVACVCYDVMFVTFTTVQPQRAHKRLVNVFITFTIAFKIGSECPFIERLVLVKTFS